MILSKEGEAVTPFAPLVAGAALDRVAGLDGWFPRTWPFAPPRRELRRIPLGREEATIWSSSNENKELRSGTEDTYLVKSLIHVS